MIYLLIVCFILILILFSYGQKLSLIINLDLNFFEKILLGLIGSNIFSSIICLFFPLTSFFFYFWVLIGIFLILYTVNPQKITKLTFQKTNEIPLLFTLIFSVISILVFFNVPVNGDSGLYHLQSIIRIQENGIIKGLANLHGRLGFNPNIFSFHALISNNIIIPENLYLTNYLILIPFCFYLLLKIFQSQNFNFILLNILTLLFILNLRRNLNSPTPDYVFSIIIIYIIYKFIDFKLFYISNHNSIFFLFLLVIYVLSIKLAALPILIFIILNFHEFLKSIKNFKFLILIFFVILPWFAQNILLTGYIIYPQTFLDFFNFPWKVPMELVNLEKNTIIGFARFPFDGYINFSGIQLTEWFPIWFYNLSIFNKSIFTLSIVVFLLVLLNLNHSEIWKKILPVLVLLFFSILFWFFTAPDFRFANSYFMGIWIVFFSTYRFQKFLIPISYLKIFFSIFSIFYLCTFLFLKPNFTVNFNLRLLTPPKNNFHLIDSNYDFIDINGKRIIFSKTGACFDKKELCTPILNNRLELIEGDIKKGFIISK